MWGKIKDNFCSYVFGKFELENIHRNAMWFRENMSTRQEWMRVKISVLVEYKCKNELSKYGKRRKIW